MARKNAREIDLEAAAWAVRLDEGLVSRDEELNLDAWLAEDVRHAGALARMRAFNSFTWKIKALGAEYESNTVTPQPQACDVQSEPEKQVESGRPTEAMAFPAQDYNAGRRFVSGPAISVPSRRLVLRAGGAIAATAVIGAMVGWEKLHADIYRTGMGATKVVALKDGSVITLNTESQIEVYFSDQERSVRLTQGEATFDVVKDPFHPFVVAAGDARVRVVGTSFTVQRINTRPIQVLVRQGVVAVSRLGRPGVPVIVKANTQATAPIEDGSIAAMPIAPSALQRQLAWQDGKIAFEGQTLAQAAAEFARYSDIKIVISDYGLAHEEIVGLFKANDPVGFAKTIALSLNARAVVGQDQVHLSR